MHKSPDTVLPAASIRVLREGSVRMPRGVPRSGAERAFSYYLDAAGVEHFNFPQSVWLAPRLAMAFTPTRSAALRTLAVNVLTAVSGERTLSVARGRTSARVLALSGAFCEEILLSAPEQAWTLPCSSVADWIAAHQRDRAVRQRRAPLQPDPR